MDEWRGSETEGKREDEWEAPFFRKGIILYLLFWHKSITSFKKNIKKLSKLSLIKLKSVYEIHEEVVLNLRVSTLRVLDDVYRD